MSPLDSTVSRSIGIAFCMTTHRVTSGFQRAKAQVTPRTVRSRGCHPRPPELARRVSTEWRGCAMAHSCAGWDNGVRSVRREGRTG